MSDTLLELRRLLQSLEARKQKARREAEILLAQADAIDVAAVDLSLAIDKAEKALTDKGAAA